MSSDENAYKPCAILYDIFSVSYKIKNIIVEYKLCQKE